ncbi:MAG TPA: hypothetical protein VG871_02185, partial [Vicinamibacterales bacterium]|nr:hypothetical protein [Vicinamibacterales bacterium]
MTRFRALVWPVVLGAYMPFCTPAVRPTAPPAGVSIDALWQQPSDIASKDLFTGDWDTRYAPDPAATYTFVALKRHGVNPGMTVRDPEGRRWSVKQPPASGQPPEGPIEVVVSRVLAAVGYHQPPVYYLPSFKLRDDWGTHREPGGRFRPHEKSLKELGTWSWQQNPFVNTRPYRGLLVILLVLDSSDLKNDNNTLYEYKSGGVTERWYVVRDLGMALGSTGRVAPRRGDPKALARNRFILGVRDGFVQFDYDGWHQELVRGRLRPDDVEWGCALLASLSQRQWEDAFRAGGYPPDV